MAHWETELTELVRRRSGALVGYAYSLTRDKPQAEDLVQDALVKVYSRLRRPPEMGNGGPQVVNLDQPQMTNAEAYVKRAILTIYLDACRRGNHWSGIKHLLADDAHVPGAEQVVTTQVDVGVALRQLSPRQREAVLLRFFEDMTVPQIAAALGTRPGTIKRHLFNALEVLRGALAHVPAPEVDTNLDQRLDAVAGAVRRRRAVKVGAVAGVSMVLAGLLAVAAWWGPSRLLSEPVPPATPSPDASTAAVGGWVPSGWPEVEGPFHCGMEVTALTSTSDTVGLELSGNAEVVGEGEDAHLAAPVRITRVDQVGSDLSGVPPQLVFARDGRVVDIGPGWLEGQYSLPDAGESATDVAQADSATACGRWTTDGTPNVQEYLDQRPAGTYDVYAVLWWSDGDGGIDGYAVSEPVTMDVPAVELPDEEPLDVDVREGYQPPWLKGTSLACGDYASDIPGRSYFTWGPDSLTTATSKKIVTMTFDTAEGQAINTTRTSVALVWLRDGRVVSVGSDVASQPTERFRVDEKGGTPIVVPRAEPDLTCLEDPAAGMPSGRYEVYALMEIDPGSADERRFISTSIWQGLSYESRG
ncbi:RNA polymerase sigma factor [Promicromonospora panici]|uniref:RNA polymerase sigma factor n=1 Tax=Promicromonospora panici TaxID=2219658 RepID=UPI00101C7BB1|nr:sigma-70 family RNA polymerase sigma factor [Promicromonospora panici]